MRSGDSPLYSVPETGRCGNVIDLVFLFLFLCFFPSREGMQAVGPGGHRHGSIYFIYSDLGLQIRLTHRQEASGLGTLGLVTSHEVRRRAMCC